MLPTFPSRYWFTIGLPEVFSLAGWSPLIRTGFHVSRPTQVDPLMHPRCLYGAVTLSGAPFRALPVPGCIPLGAPTTPAHPKIHRFGLFPFRSPLLRESIFLPLPMGTKMVQFPTFAPPSRMVTGLQPAGLPHSDTAGSTPVCRSPAIFAAYRVLPRLRKPRHPPFALLRFLFVNRLSSRGRLAAPQNVSSNSFCL